MATEEQALRIFVVDDEPVIASTLALILRDCGFSTVSFTDPVEALEAARLQTPDMLISDVIMPRLSGIDLAILLQEHCPTCKILLFSGQAATADLLAPARALGHDFSLLLKPAHPREIMRRIQALSGREC